MSHDQPSGVNAESPDPQPPIRVPPISLAVACLLLGVLSIVTSFLLIGALLGVVGIFVGIGHNRRYPYLHGMTGVGMLLSLVGLMLTIPTGLFYYQTFTQFQEMMSGMEMPEFENWEGVAAPDLTLTTLSGEQLSLQDLRGKRVIVDIWATWCPPCRDEIPHFQKLADEHPDDLVVIGVSNEDEKTLREFVEEEKVTYAIVSAQDLPSPFSDVVALPTTFFIDRNGIFQTVLEGYHDFDSLREHALAEDYTGDVREEPSSSVPELTYADELAPPVLLWEQEQAVSAMAKGDWTGDGNDEALVLNEEGKLIVLRSDGTVVSELQLSSADYIEMGRHAEGVRLLVHSSWGDKVEVFDSEGVLLWEYGARMGVNAAHWVDLDGDGDDELTVGMNGSGGLHAVSSDGKRLWRYGRIGNVWTHASLRTVGGASRIFATEAGGSIHVLDEGGKKVEGFRPNGHYYTSVYASTMDTEGSVQAMVIASEDPVAVVCNPEGDVLWQAAMGTLDEFFEHVVLVGDLDGDRVKEWAFIGHDDSLLVVSSEGIVQASLDSYSDVRHGAILETPSAHGVLLLHRGNMLRAYSVHSENSLHEVEAL